MSDKAKVAVESISVKDLEKVVLTSPFEEEVSERKSSSEKDETELKKPSYEFKEGDFTAIGDCFLVETGIKQILDRNVKKAVNTMLLGPTGVGKTEMIANIAAELNVPLTIFDMGTMTDPIMSLVGSHVVEMHDGVTRSVFKRSRFSEVIQQPGIVLLDEISRASAAANNLLFPCLDFRRTLAMEYDFTNPEPVNIHPECVFVATANLGSQYTGTHKLDRALVDRFMIIEIDPLDEINVRRIIAHNYPALSKKTVNVIVGAYFKINKAHEEYKIAFNLSLRHLKLISELVVDGFTIYDAYYVICKGVGNKDGVTAIKEVLDSTRRV